MRPATTPVAIPFPIRGMDTGAPGFGLPEGFSRLVRNAHGFHQGNSYGGGKRPGFVRQGGALSGVGGSTQPNRVYHIQNVDASVGGSGFQGTARLLAILDGRAAKYDYTSGAWSSYATGGFTVAGGLDIGTPEQMATLGEKVYGGIGTAKYVYDTNPATPTVATWTASSGTIPDFQLYETFRGRVFGARTASNPSLWACSRIFAPLDWDFNADPITSSAASSAIGDAGQPSDVITALVPFSDDRLVFGCFNSLWELRGDPQAGGKVVILSPDTGIVGGRAWTFDEHGTLYFFSLSGLWKLGRGEVLPRPVSLRRMDEYIDQINVARDTAGALVQLGYDSYRKRVMIFLTTRTGYTVNSSLPHVVYDTLADEFVLYTFATAATGPLSLANQRGPTDDLKGVAIGTDRGAVLVQQNGIPYDYTSGTADAIDVRIDFAPQAFAGHGRPSVVRRLHFTMEENANFQPFNYYWLVASSEAEIETLGTGDAVASGTIGQASVQTFRNPILEIRRRGIWHKLIITQNINNGDLRFSRIDADVEGRGRVRL